MKKKHAVRLMLLLAALAILVGAAAPSGGSGSDDEARASLLETDEELSDLLSDPEAFGRYVAPDVHFLPPDVPRMKGREAFLSNLEPLLAMGLTWSPDVAQVSAGGDLGYTIGTFELTLKDPDGSPLKRVGKYKTVWQRRADGGWWIVADTFNFDAPME